MASELKDMIAEALREPVKAYIPGITRMASKDFWAMAKLLFQADDPAKARDVIRPYMDAEELTKEKEELSVLAEILANERADSKEFANAILKSILRVAIKVAVGI